jgi:acetyl-CoA carboxylase beta subunit
VVLVEIALDPHCLIASKFAEKLHAAQENGECEGIGVAEGGFELADTTTVAFMFEQGSLGQVAVIQVVKKL